MAQRVEIKSITVPAATLSTAPQTTLLDWRSGYPERVEFRIPPGPSGLLGLRLLHSGTRIIPRSEDEWLVTDNEAVIWPLEGYPYNANWQVQAYNTDVYDHTFQIRMLMNELTPATVPTFTPIDVAPEAIAEDETTEEDLAAFIVDEGA